jgi:hypothetical protein
MARLIERTFDPARPVYVRRFFVAAGRHLQPGDLFDWRRWSIDQRKTRQLFDVGKLMHDATASVVTPAPTALQEVEDEAILIAASEAPEAPPTEAPEAPPTEAPEAQPEDDGLDDMNMIQLRAIAAEEGAPTRQRRDDQRAVIRENRLARAGG